MIGDYDQIYVKVHTFEQLVRDSRELKRAKALIHRLRIKNTVLVDEKKRFIDTVRNARRHISIAGNIQKKWAVTLVLRLLEKARLI